MALIECQSCDHMTGARNPLGKCACCVRRKGFAYVVCPCPFPGCQCHPDKPKDEAAFVKNPDLVSISPEELQKLMDDQHMLRKLEQAGVKDWVGYGYACELARADKKI